LQAATSSGSIGHFWTPVVSLNQTTDSVDLTTKPDLEDEGASRNEESTEENNVEFVEQAMVERMRDCVLFRGLWVKDDDECPLYQPGSCY
ncbi:unnamed protein product, partial [Brassica oleracea var. botrytis]